MILSQKAMTALTGWGRINSRRVRPEGQRPSGAVGRWVVKGGRTSPALVGSPGGASAPWLDRGEQLCPGDHGPWGLVTEWGQVPPWPPPSG